MTTFFDKLFTRYPIKTKRLLEIIPGALSWTLILSPIWASLFIPSAFAYFILFFDVYWFYKSFSLAITATIASKKIRKGEKENWLEKTNNLADVEKVYHFVIIPNYKEYIHKLRYTLKVLTRQTFPTKQIYIVLAMEKREDDAKEKSETLIKEFGHKFAGVIATFHPDRDGEVKGKSSNEAFASKYVYKEIIEKGKADINFATVSSVDADSVFDPQYYACLTYKFLTDPKRYNKFWQSAIVYYNNIWEVPAPTRIISFFGSLWRTAVLIQPDQLITHATYSLSFLLLKNIDFWDTDVIPEDYRVFFKAFYRMKGDIAAEPIFLKTSMDAALSSGYVKSLKNKYYQERRWSWGVADDPLFIKWWFTVPGVPFFKKTIMLYHVLLDHFLWPVYWFIITLAANILPFINPVFTRTTIGYKLPQLAGLILTSCLFATLAMIIIDYQNRPKHGYLSPVRQFLFPLEFVLLPLVGLFLSSLPAIVSHTQLMLGKHPEYKVTEKV